MLQKGKSHGYDLKDDLAPFGMGNVNPSLVYRSLRDMEDEGFVKSEWDTETTAGPARRVYQITEDGLTHLQQWARDLRETDRILHHFLQAVDEVLEDEAESQTNDK
jgi:DNA-binding PadR family transcriptional regulator